MIYCYMLECANQAIYTGWTNNLKKRVKQHNAGKGAKYTKQNRPVKMVYWETQPNKPTALRREKRLKNFTHLQKKSLITEWSHLMTIENPLKKYQYLSTAPGRVNLLGEHIDYNGGSVLPAAIDRKVHLGANPRDDHLVRLTALDLNEEVCFSLTNLAEKTDCSGNPLPEWANFPAGVAWAAQQQGFPVSGIDGAFFSNIPMGSGLSSSAAVEVAFAALWRELGEWSLDNLELAILCQKAENLYVGVNCGLMDQFSVANGVDNAALLFNTQTHHWEPVHLPDDVAIIIADSKKRRSLATSAYNERRQACEEALSILKQDLPAINSLADVSLEAFEKFGGSLPENIHKRAQHVVEECHRVEEAVVFLNSGDIHAFGNLMFEGHASLRDLYEVSIPELDILVDAARKIEGCYGARLSGAGFGGCTVSIVQKSQAKNFITALEKIYLEKTGIQAEIYLCHASEGVSVKWHDVN